MGAEDLEEKHGEVAVIIRDYLLKSFLLDEKDLSMDMSLIDSGIIDSTGIMEIVAFMEDTFGIEVDDRDLTPANFDSVSRLASYVAQRYRDSQT